MSNEFEYYGNAKSIYRAEALNNQNNNGISDLEYKLKSSTLAFFLFSFIVSTCILIVFFFLPIPRKISLQGEIFQTEISVYKSPLAGYINFHNENEIKKDSVLFTISKNFKKIPSVNEESFISNLYEARRNTLKENLQLTLEKLAKELELKKTQLRFSTRKLQNLELQREKLKSKEMTLREIYRINDVANKHGSTSKIELERSKVIYNESELAILKLNNEIEEIRLSVGMVNNEISNIYNTIKVKENDYELLFQNIKLSNYDYRKENYFLQESHTDGFFYKNPFIQSNLLINENQVIGYLIHNGSKMIVRSKSSSEFSHFLSIGYKAILKIRDKVKAQDVLMEGELLGITPLKLFNSKTNEDDWKSNQSILSFSIKNKADLGTFPLGTPVEINIKLPEKTIFNRIFNYEKS